MLAFCREWIAPHGLHQPGCRYAGLIPALVLLCLPAAAVVAADSTPPLASAPTGTSASSPLPVRDVVLFSSGVGYFQHAGEIAGPTTLQFPFRSEQLNDLLKSLVLLDPAGGVRPVTYTAPDPVSHSLAGLGIDLNNAASLGGILRQFQGSRLHVTTGSGDYEGPLVSVSSQPRPGKDTVIQVEVLNLLTGGGLVALPMDEVKSVKILDESLDRQFQEALALLARGRDQGRKTLAVEFDGDRRREVRMGYLLESPVWKSSYRLVLGEKAPYLQGWAVVENGTDQDWNGVRLSLVSGRPVSFIQDLSTPLYVARPVVAPQVIGSPAPQLYGAAVEKDEEALQLETRSEAARTANEPAMAPGAAGLGARRFAPGRRDRAAGLAAGEPQVAAKSAERELLRASVDQIAASVASQAQGAERGELFEYAIPTPVTLPSHGAAMVPLVGADVGGGKVSIYTPSVNREHPMNAFRIKNTTGLHLAGGPITVFDDGVYAGDAQIETLQPGEERLLSYAVDLAVEGKQEVETQPEQLLSMKAEAGVLHFIRKQRIEDTYTLRNKDTKPRTVLIEQPIQPGWSLVQPAKADEKTADKYRFEVSVPADKSGTLRVITEQPVSESIALVDADINTVLAYAQNAKLSEPLRAALKELVALRQRVAGIQAQRAASEAEIAAIGEEQKRIRDNMRELDRQSDLYRQYVKKLSAQESRIEELRANIQRLRDAENAAQDAVRKFLATLNVE